MPSSSSVSTNKKNENNDQKPSLLKNSDNENKSDLGVNIVLIGAPGSGKGTQSAHLVERYQICQLSTGDLLRQATQDKTSLEGQKIRKIMEAGGLVDDKIVMSLIDKNLNKPECHHGVLFDGFPRTINQGEQLEKLLESRQKRLDAVLEYAIDDSLLKRRILGRLVHKPSGRTYHEEFQPPKQLMKDDITGELLERRSDDTNETLDARLHTYHKQTTPLIEFYRQRNILHSIDATQKVNEISQKSIEIIDYLRKQPNYKSSTIARQQDSIRKTETNLENKNTSVLKTKSTTEQFEINKGHLSNHFLSIYNPVISVLRDRGII